MWWYFMFGSEELRKWFCVVRCKVYLFSYGSSYIEVKDVFDIVKF
jgi:hypothetical protein